MAPPRTAGEAQACASRSVLWFMAVLHQVHAAVVYSAFLAGDPLYFTCVPWRLPLLLSMYAYASLALLILSHVELFLPRVPFAVHQALLYRGLIAVGGGVVNPMGSFVLGLPAGHDGVVAACTCLIAVLIGGLLVLWGWLARGYGGGGQPHAHAFWKKYRKHVVVENLGVSCPANVAPSSNRLW
ncbi:hypothetical protein VPH35_123034 [Triticum aestivum]